MARYAADTHVFAWYWRGSKRVSSLARETLDGATLLTADKETIVADIVPVAWEQPGYCVARRERFRHAILLIHA